MRAHLFFVCLCLVHSTSGCGAPLGDRVDAQTLTRGASLSASCSGCHSVLGGDAIVSLSDWSEMELSNRLTDYQTETDGQTVMHRIARGYSDADIAAISAYLAQADAE